MDTVSPLLAIGPHRAYRRLPVLSPASIGVSLVLLLSVEIPLLIFLEDVVRVFGLATFELARYTRTSAQLGSDRLLGVPLYPIVFGSVPPHSYQALLLWLGGSVAGVALLSRFRWVVAPLRYFVNYNFLLIAASALYLLFAGHLGYDAEAFSRLYLRTVIVMWLVAPVVMVGLSLTVPFSPGEQLALVVATLSYDMVFSAVRYALFVWVLTHLGAVVMANLYLSLGPLLDVIYFVGILAVFLPRVSRRLGRTAGFLA